MADVSLKEYSNYRIALVHNPSGTAEETRPSSNSLSCQLSRLHAAFALNQTRPTDLLAVLDSQTKAMLGEAQNPLIEQSPTLREAFLLRDDGAADVACVNFSESGRLLAREFDIAPGEQALVVNGRVSVSF